MIWIVLAIIAAGYFIGDGIRKAAATKVVADATMEQARLDQERELAERKQRHELETSPHYQRMIGLSLEFVEYMNNWNSHTSYLQSAQEVLLTRKDLTKQQVVHYLKTVKDEEQARRHLQQKCFAKWDKLERQLDPRQHLLTSNGEVGIKWEQCEEVRKELHEQYNRIVELEKEKPNIAKKLAAISEHAKQLAVG